MATWVRWAWVLIIALAVTTLARPSAVSASDGRYYSETGFAIEDPRFLEFFDRRGGLASFGYPVSREFTFHGYPTQVFQRAIMQEGADGQVQLLNLLDPGLFPYTRVNGAVYPGVDAALVASAPAVGSPGYSAAILQWISSTAPDRWEELPVGFHQSFLATVPAKIAFPSGNVDEAILTGFDLEVWGVPTSRPAFDPSNRGVVYQRFQRGILQYDTQCGCTRGVLLADYFKAILLGKNLPADLLAAAKTSPYFGQYDATKPGWVARPAELPDTDLTRAFEPVTPSGAPAATGAPAKTGTAPPPAVHATAIAVLDEGSGALLYGKNPHERLAPASVTKIFTTLVALRYGTLAKPITVQFDPSELSDSTLMGIHPGETYTLEDLLYGLMLPSGNDAALAIANGVGGSVDHFVALMNAQAADLSLHDSHFVNPHGLDAPGHYTSAYDLAIAARYGMTQYPEFRKLVIARTWTVNGTRTFKVYNLNRFLWSYPGADGVKIGYTDAAGHTIVASATRNGHRIYVVLLNCDDIVDDSVPLFNWVFDNFTWPN
ncbi:MAG TPA: D-alanyl-D-alanine carboxypeptidase family protein [Chloroflexota bacterium]|nr:D-alanyl-D-alanine carboxypeptidase family protein [Chloroflexota bacterium]